METWASSIGGILWHNAWAVVPLILIVALLGRWLPCRPATRHALWLTALLGFVLPAFLPNSPLPWPDAPIRSETGDTIAPERHNQALAHDGPAVSEQPSPRGPGRVERQLKHPRLKAQAKSATALSAAPTDDMSFSAGADAPFVNNNNGSSAAGRANRNENSRLAKGGDAYSVITQSGASTEIVEACKPKTAAASTGTRAIAPADAAQTASTQKPPASKGAHATTQAPTPPWAVVRAESILPKWLAPANGSAGPLLPLDDLSVRPWRRVEGSKEENESQSGPRRQDCARRIDIGIIHFLRGLCNSFRAGLREIPTFQAAFTSPFDRANPTDYPTTTPSDDAIAQSPAAEPVNLMATLRETAPNGQPVETAAGRRPVADAPSVRDAFHSTPDDPAAAPAVGDGQLRLLAWLSGLAAVRDAAVNLPPLPWPVWLAGLVLIVCKGTVDVLRFRRRLRRARGAPPVVQRLVEQAAARLGLRSAPETRVVEDRMSPMILCGMRPRLILPRPLWNELDDAGRRAIVYHELAHLRRRDHWILWVERVIACIYWWHPLLWWVRRRLHEEAEFCCDAWVTALLPRGRRSYAEALLRTKQYVSESPVAVPASGIGMTTVRARRLARRLTMVMTENVRPGLSAAGALAALTAAIIGWLAMPARACPPTADQPPDCTVTAPVAPAALAAPIAPAPPTAPGAPAAIAPAAPLTVHYHSSAAPAGAPAFSRGVTTTYQEHMAHRGSTIAKAPPAPKHAPSDDVGARLSRLEDELARVTRMLEELMAQRGDFGPTRRTTPAPPAMGGAGGRLFGGTNITPPPAQPGAFDMIAPQGMGGGSGVRVYKVAKGKLEALANLMTRSDVPVRVSVQGDTIQVHGSEAAQRAFQRFVEVIDRGDHTRTFKVPAGKREALIELMSRNDVQILVAPLPDGIQVHGTREELESVGRFIDLINGQLRVEAAPQPPPGSELIPEIALAAELMNRGEAQKAHELIAVAELRKQAPEAIVDPQHLADALVQAREHLEHAQTVNDGVTFYTALYADYQHQVAKFREQLKAAQREFEQRERAREEMERRADAMEREADRVEERADRLDERAEELEDQIEQMNEEGESNERTQARMEELRARAADARAQAAAMREEANRIRAAAHEVRAQVESLERECEALEATLPDLELQVDNADETMQRLRDLLKDAQKRLDEHKKKSAETAR